MTAIDDRPRTDWSGQLAGIDVAGELEIECAPTPMTLEKMMALQTQVYEERQLRMARQAQTRLMLQLEQERRETFGDHGEFYCYCSPSRGALFQEQQRRARRRVSPMAVALVMIAYMAMLIVLVGVM